MHMKERTVIRKWQLLRWRSNREEADFSDADFIAVGKRVFRDRRHLEKVIFPPMLSAIKTDAFRECPRLFSVTLPAENNVGIAAGAFADCIRLREVIHSELVSTVGMGSFENCRMLREFPFGRELRRIGDFAFRGCASLTAVTLPSCLIGIGTAAFADCTELNQLELEDSLSALSPELFRGCISLSEIKLPSTLQMLPSGVFRDCSALRELTVPTGIRKIGSSAFRGCARLRKVTLEIGVQRIGAFAFAGTAGLEEIYVPHTIKFLAFGAFGLGTTQKPPTLYVDNEYMRRRMKRLLLLCGSAGRVRICVIGKSIEERKRERHRSTVHQTPTHLT